MKVKFCINGHKIRMEDELFDLHGNMFCRYCKADKIKDAENFGHSSSDVPDEPIDCQVIPTPVLIYDVSKLFGKK